MKKLLSLTAAVLMTIFSQNAKAQTTLAAGDVAIIGTNPASTDAFAFVLLKDIATNTVINFTDGGFASSTTGWTGEGYLTYTAPSAKTAGTVISWTNGMTIAGTGWNSNNPTNFALNSSGDQLFAFQGTADDTHWGNQSGITVLFGVNYGVALKTSGSASNSTTYQPSTSILPATAFINLPSATNTNGYFANGTSSTSSVTVSGTNTALLALFVNTAKWFGNSTTQVTFPTWTITVTCFGPPTSVTASTTNTPPICSGTTLHLLVTATGATSYSWSGPNGFTAATGDPSIANVTTAATGTYTVTATNSCGSASSTTAVTINSTVTPSVSIASGSGTTNCAGTNVTFTATPTNGGASPSYQWKLNGSNVGANSNTYSNNTLANNDQVTCVLTSNATCASPTTATSNTLTMTVTPSVTPSVSIAAGSGPTNCAGTNVTFTATPTNGGASPTYQWKLNGSNVGTNSDTYSNNTLTDNDQVTCVLTSNATCASPASATSNTLTMTVTPSVTPSVTISADAPTTFCAGVNPITFTAIPVNGGSSPSYQWKSNGANVGTNSDKEYNTDPYVEDVNIICTLTSNANCATTTTANSNTISVHVKNNSTSGTTQTACNSFVWNGTTYTTAGTYTYHTTNAEGCDSTATLNLTINNSSTSSSAVSACDSLAWNGATYTASGTYTYHTTNAAGCDSTATLILTINNNSTSNTSVSNCGSYVWNGTTYSASGTYVYHTANAAGCDSAATLVLTITPGAPAQPAAFTAKTTFVYKGQKTVAYTVPNDPSATYSWTYGGTGATINGSGNSVTIDYSSSATSGALSVTANNLCGPGAARTLAIVLNDTIIVPTTNYDYSFVTLGCNRVDYLDTTFSTGDADYACGTSTANVYQLKRVFTEISHLTPLPKYLFMTGDIVMGYINDTVALAKQLNGWRAIYESHPLSSMGITLVAIPGNHETEDKANGKKSFIAAERTFMRVMAPYIAGSNGPGIGGPDGLTTDQSKLTYSFNHGSDHFIVIDTDPVGKDGITPYKWIGSDIQAAKAAHARHIFAFGHKPAYSSPYTPQGGLDAASTLAQRDSLWKYLENNNCEAMFSAHEHLWDSIHPHTGKTWQVINGNGGTRVETTWTGSGKQYYGYTLVNLYTDRKVNVMGLGRNTDMSPTVGTAYTINEDANPTTIRNNFNICLTTTSSTTVSSCANYVWNGTTYTASGNYTYTTANSAGCDSVATLVLTINPTPSQPADFTASSANVTQGQNGVVYTVPNDATATYTWSYTGTGATINGTTNSVTVDYSASATSGTLNVSAIANNGCGTSAPTSIAVTVAPSVSFTAGRLIVVKTSGTASKQSSPVTLVEYQTNGTIGASLAIPKTGATPFQISGIYGGSEGFLTTSTDGRLLMLGGYGTTKDTVDITLTNAALAPRVVASVDATGTYSQLGSSTVYYTKNDIRGAISDGTNYWASGASNATDGINYYGPGTQAALGVGAKAYGLRVFNGQIYFSTQKVVAGVTPNFGIYSLGSGMPISGTITPTAVINTGAIIPEDFSFNPAGNVCYIAVNVNGATGGVQKWTKSGSVWSLAYTLNTGVANIGAYGLLADYSASPTVIYATTFEATTATTGGNRIVKITDNGTLATEAVSTIVPATAGVVYHGISFAPCSNPPAISSASGNGPICAGSTLSLSAAATGSDPLSYSWTGPNSFSSATQNPSISNATVAASGTYTLSVSNGCGISATSTAAVVVNPTVTPSVSIGANPGNTICAGTNVIFTATPTNGGASPAYQWTLNGVNVGTNSNTYSNNTLTAGDSATCTLTSNVACALTTTANSNTITINVTATVVPSVSIASGSGNTNCNGANVMFTATPTNGGATPSYQWTLNGGNVGSNSATYSNNTLSDQDVVACVMTSSNACALPTTATSNNLTMTVNPNVTPTVSVGANPGNIICAGTSVTFTSTPVNGGATPSYQWTKNGTNVGTNSDTYTDAALADGDVIVCTMTSSATCVTSATASSSAITMTVNPVASQPTDFTASSSSVNKGQSGVIYTVPNDATVTYSWSYNGNGATINGTGNSVTVDFSSIATSGTLSVIAINGCGNSASRDVAVTINTSNFSEGNLVVLQTTGNVSKASNAITISEFTTNGVPGLTFTLPSSGTNPIQTSGIFGGSEGFLTRSTDGKFLAVAGFGTSATFSDITGTLSSAVPRVVGEVSPSGAYTQVASSSGFFSGNDIRGAVSDGTNFWASGASVSSLDGIDYYAPGTQVGLATGATPPKAYGLRIFNGQIYYSSQKAGPVSDAAHLGIFALSNGSPTSGTQTVTQIINTGTTIVEDFSFSPAGDVCYIAVNLISSAGGVQKWTNVGGVWTYQYTLGLTNIGAYGVEVDYSGVNPVIYATTFESGGNRVIKITDTGAGSSVSTIVSYVPGVFNKGITFAPIDGGTPTVNISVNPTAGSESGQTVITVTATASSAVTGDQTVSVNVSGTGITAGDYTLSNTTITIPGGSSSGSVTFTIVDDSIVEGNETAVLTLGNPSSGILLGAITSQNVTITDNDGNNPPTITMNVATTSDEIDGGAVISPTSPYPFSGTIFDPNDPGSVLGIDFSIADVETAASSLTVTASSSNTTVVPNANLVVSGTGAIRNVKITPARRGNSTITVTVSDGVNNTSYLINYAASYEDPQIIPANTLWNTGISDASDAIAIDDNYYMTGDDEIDVVNVYSRTTPGLPAVSFNFASYLNLPDPGKPEMDTEAAAESPKHPGTSYYLGSMSNGKYPFDDKPNRDRIAAIHHSGTGTSTSLTFAGYCAIKSTLLTWGDANGYNLTASAQPGLDSKSTLDDGFAAEGMTFGPDSTTLWIGLRAPLVPVTNRHLALIAPILNFETWFNNGSQSGTPVFGTPIELDLGGRAIRELARMTNGTYIIIAGDPSADNSTQAIFKWTGNVTDAPKQVPSAADGVITMEGVMQVSVAGQPDLTKLQVITDGGSALLYNDSTEAKDYTDLNFRKFRSDLLVGLNLNLCTFTPTVSANNSVSFCPGDSVVLTADNTNSSYLWSNGRTTRSITVKTPGNFSVAVVDSTGCSGTSPVTTTSIHTLPTDINRDGVVNVNDFLQFNGAFNTTCSGCPEDINNDGTVDVNDFLQFVGDYNKTCH